MNIKKPWYLLVIALVVIMLSVPTNLTLAESSPDMVDVLVTFTYPPGPAEEDLIRDIGGVVNRTYHLVPAIAASIPPDQIDTLEAYPEVLYVELDNVVQIAQEEILPWGVDRIDADLVHPTYKGEGVKIAILDTGIDLDHPDLAVAGDVTFVNGTTNGDDNNGHGTSVTGVIAALDNDIGTIGVAPAADIYSVKVLAQDASGTISDIIAGIEWSVDNGMQIINMSLGSSMPWPLTAQAALDKAYFSGILIIAGAGNSGQPDGQGDNILYPARYYSVVCAASTDNQDVRAPNSSTGPDAELAAPGVNIYTTAMGGGYETSGGASLAASHITGTAALVINSGVTNNLLIRERLQQTTEDLGTVGWDMQYGFGLVDAYQAISEPTNPVPPPPDTRPPATSLYFSGTTGLRGWWVSDVEITIYALDDPYGSGVAQTQYSLNNGATWQDYTAPFIVSSEGETFMLAKSIDVIGNEETPVSASFRIDKTPPEVSVTATPDVLEPPNGKLIDVYIYGSSSDAMSGMDYTNFSIEDEYDLVEPVIGGFGTYIQLEAARDGTDKDGRLYTIIVDTADRAGNQAVAQAFVTVPH